MLHPNAKTAIEWGVLFCGALVAAGGIGLTLKKAGVGQEEPGFFICETNGQASTLWGGITEVRQSNEWIRVYSEDYGAMLYRPGEREVCILRVVSAADLGGIADEWDSTKSDVPSEMKL